MISDEFLRSALEQRFRGDRTGACVEAATIENGTIRTARVCSGEQRPVDSNAAFEIGSLAKTMTGALLAEIIQSGEIALDDPLARLLPHETIVPSFSNSQITIGNVVTHSSGLPSFPWKATNADDPYASLGDTDLLNALGRTTLTRAPGRVFRLRTSDAPPLQSIRAEDHLLAS